MNAKVAAGEPPTVQPSITLAELKARFSDEDACKALVRDVRWPDGVACPRCNRTEKIYALKARPFHWVCKNADCGKRNGYRFSVITKTVFENTNYPLRTWFEVLYLMSQSKKGISALQIHRQIGSGDYRTAWYMCQRIRAAMDDPEFRGKLGGDGGSVEVDEAHLGGEDRNRYWNKKSRQQREAAGERPLGAIARDGDAIAKVTGDTDAETLSGFVRNLVNGIVSLFATDEKQDPNYVDRRTEHAAVHHGAGESVRGEVHTNNIESFWSLLKRAVAMYRDVSKKYLPLCLNEFCSGLTTAKTLRFKDPEVPKLAGTAASQAR